MYLRDGRGARGALAGAVAAFDRHFNLVLEAAPGAAGVEAGLFHFGDSGPPCQSYFEVIGILSEFIFTLYKFFLNSSEI